MHLYLQVGQFSYQFNINSINAILNCFELFYKLWFAGCNYSLSSSSKSTRKSLLQQHQYVGIDVCMYILNIHSTGNRKRWKIPQSSPRTCQSLSSLSGTMAAFAIEPDHSHSLPPGLPDRLRPLLYIFQIWEKNNRIIIKQLKKIFRHSVQYSIQLVRYEYIITCLGESAHSSRNHRG